VGSLSTRLRVRFHLGNHYRQAPKLAISARWRLSGDLLPIATRAAGVEAYRFVSSAWSYRFGAYSAANGDSLVLLSSTRSSNPALSADIYSDGCDDAIVTSDSTSYVFDYDAASQPRKVEWSSSNVVLGMPIVADANCENQFETIVVTAIAHVHRIGRTPTTLSGVYNLGGAVNSADYRKWHNTLHSTTDLRANANGKCIVIQAGYRRRKSPIGRTASNGRAVVAAPAEQAVASSLPRAQGSAGGSREEPSLDLNFRRGSDSTRTSARGRALAKFDIWYGCDKSQPPQLPSDGKKATSKRDLVLLLGVAYFAGDSPFKSIGWRRFGPRNVAVFGVNAALSDKLKNSEHRMIAPLKLMTTATKKRVRTTRSEELRKISTRIPQWWR
jgi:hypothetical protein